MTCDVYLSKCHNDNNAILNANVIRVLNNIGVGVATDQKMENLNQKLQRRNMFPFFIYANNNNMIFL